MLVIILVLIVIALLLTLFNFFTGKSLFGGNPVIPTHGRDVQWKNVISNNNDFVYKFNKLTASDQTNMPNHPIRAPYRFGSLQTLNIVMKQEDVAEINDDSKYMSSRNNKDLLLNNYHNIDPNNIEFGQILNQTDENSFIFDTILKASHGDVEHIENILNGYYDPNRLIENCFFKFYSNTLKTNSNVYDNYIQMLQTQQMQPNQTTQYRIQYYINVCLKLYKELKERNPNGVPLITRIDNRHRSVLSIGDIHGDLSALINNLMKYMHILTFDPNCILVFTGDYVDRGSYNYEVVLLLFELKLIFPDRIYLIRGNHEDSAIAHVSDNYRGVNLLYDLCSKFGSCGFLYVFKAYALTCSIFALLPYILIVDDDKMFMHGFIPKSLKNTNIFTYEQTVSEYYYAPILAQDELAFQVLWYDYPSFTTARGAPVVNPDEVSDTFGLDDLIEFHNTNPSIKFITKGHDHSGSFNTLTRSGITVNICISSPLVIGMQMDYTNAEVDSGALNGNRYFMEQGNNALNDVYKKEAYTIKRVEGYNDDQWGRQPAVQLNRYENVNFNREVFAHAIYYYSQEVEDILQQKYPQMDINTKYIKISNNYAGNTYDISSTNYENYYAYRKGIILVLARVHYNYDISLKTIIDANIINSWIWPPDKLDFVGIYNHAMVMHPSRDINTNKPVVDINTYIKVLISFEIASNNGQISDERKNLIINIVNSITKDDNGVVIPNVDFEVCIELIRLGIINHFTNEELLTHVQYMKNRVSLLSQKYNAEQNGNAELAQTINNNVANLLRDEFIMFQNQVASHRQVQQQNQQQNQQQVQQQNQTQ